MAEMTRRIPRLAPGVSVESTGTDLLAFDGVTLSRLVGSLAVVAGLVDGLRSVKGIAQVVAVSSGRSGEDILWDVVAALDQLASHGLVQLHQSAHQPVVRCAQHVGWCEDGDRAVLVDLRSGERHALDAGGARTWQLLVTLGSTAAVAKRLSASYPDTPGLTEDIAHFTADLLERGLLERA